MFDMRKRRREVDAGRRRNLQYRPSGSKTNTRRSGFFRDALIVCPIAFGDTLSKGERLAVYYNGGKFDTFDVVNRQERNRLYAVYAKLNLTTRLILKREMKLVVEDRTQRVINEFSNRRKKRLLLQAMPLKPP